MLGSGRRHFFSHVLGLPLRDALHNTTLIISHDEMKDIVETVKSLVDSGSLSKWVGKTIQNEAKEQKGGFLSMLLGILGASLLGNILAGKWINRVGEGIVRAGYGKSSKNSNKNQNGFLMLLHPLTNFQIQKYYHNQPRFNVFILEIIYQK